VYYVNTNKTNSAKDSHPVQTNASLSVPYDNISQIEPWWPDKNPLVEKAVQLVRLSGELSSKLNPISRSGLGISLNLMNSYYSNLIEGNTTKPLDIERAQRGEYSTTPRYRALQIESAAHIEVQTEFEERVRANPKIRICSAEFLRDIHRAFYKRLPDELRRIVTPTGETKIVEPGEFRTDEVQVGLHIPPHFGNLDQFLDRFEQEYDPTALSSIDGIIASMASLHRLTWIHPFLDGNGRVVRLFTHLYLIRAGVDGGGLWALSRGIARKQSEYYAALEAADQHRYNDYDGRGNLSLRGLDRFTNFLFDTAIDQVEFMSKSLELDTIIDRLRGYAMSLVAQKNFHPASEAVMAELMYRGEIKRSDMANVTGLSDRSSRRIAEQLHASAIIASSTKLSPWRLNFNVELMQNIFPSLY
jgi:Fic family protein